MGVLVLGIMSEENRINRLINNNFDGDQITCMGLLAFDLKEFSNILKDIGLKPIGGLEDIVNTVSNGRPLGKKKQRLVDNIQKSFDSYPRQAPGGYSDSLSTIMKRTLEKTTEYFGNIEIEDPVKYHSKHLVLVDLEQMIYFMNDQTAATRRILELTKLNRAELVLPALKDQYVLTFEKIYKIVKKQIADMVKDAVKDKKQMD